MAKQKPSSTGTQARAIPANDAMLAPMACAQTIAVAAYYLAEQRGFSPGRELEDWLRAEEEVESRLRSGLPPGGS